MTFFLTRDDKLTTVDSIARGCWVRMTQPTKEEIDTVCATLTIDPAMFTAALDEEERAHVEEDDHNTLIIVDVPVTQREDNGVSFTTMPMGIILCDHIIVTVSLTPVRLFDDIISRGRGFATQKHSRFVLQILGVIAAEFLADLRQIDRQTNALERRLQQTLRNKDLLEMTRFEKSLVYFSTSLKSNDLVLQRLLRLERVQKYEEDTELLEDVIIENKQAIEMCTIFRDILNNTMNTFAAIISNSVNEIMRFLTGITLVLAIPTFIASLWGMNVPVPFQGHSGGFYLVLGLSLLLSVTVTIVMSRRRML